MASMRFLAEVQEETGTVRNSYGEKVPVFTTRSTRRISIQTTAGQEFFDGNRVQANVTHEIEMRYYPDLTPKWRLRIPPTRRYTTERIFNIEAVLDANNVRHLHRLRCKEVVT